MMRRTCPCGHGTTADLPPGIRGGPTCYGPNVSAAATLLASTDVIGIERAADLMSVLLGVEVSTGFVSSCLVRLDDAVQAAGFEDAVKDAPAGRGRGRDRRDPGPADRDGDRSRGLPQPARLHRPHPGRLHRWRPGPGLVRRGRGPHQGRSTPSGSSTDSVRCWSATTTAATPPTTPTWPGSNSASPTCCATSTTPTPSTWQPRAGPVRSPTPYARPSVSTARAAGRTSLHPALLARLRRSYDTGVAVGISTNASRRWHTGTHPGLQLAKRLQRKKSQVWIFTERFDVPPTNNGSESAIRGYKQAAKISGCWRALATLTPLPDPVLPDPGSRHCRDPGERDLRRSLTLGRELTRSVDAEGQRRRVWLLDEVSTLPGWSAVLKAARDGTAFRRRHRGRHRQPVGAERGHRRQPDGRPRRHDDGTAAAPRPADELPGLPCSDPTRLGPARGGASRSTARS